MVEFLEIGLEDGFWIVFVALISISTIDNVRWFEGAISILASKSCYATLLNKGLWARFSHATTNLNLSPFDRFELKATFVKNKVLVEVTGSSEEYMLPYTVVNVTLRSGNYRILWNGSLLVVREWEG